MIFIENNIIYLKYNFQQPTWSTSEEYTYNSNEWKQHSCLRSCPWYKLKLGTEATDRIFTVFGGGEG